MSITGIIVMLIMIMMIVWQGVNWEVIGKFARNSIFKDEVIVMERGWQRGKDKLARLTVIWISLFENRETAMLSKGECSQAGRSHVCKIFNL